jgi:hypothetical protein
VGDSLTPPTPPGNGPRRSVRERWREQVISSSRIHDATRVLLLVLADDMREDGYVTVPREVLARRLDRTERKVSARLAEAVDARLLDRVVRGQKGRTAVYRALLRVPGTGTLSDDDRVTATSTLNRTTDTATRHPDGGFRVPHGGPTSTKASSTERRGETPSGAGSTSLSEKKEKPNRAETEQARAVIVRACESWGLPVPDELRESA